MADDQGWRKEPLANGGYAYIVQRKYDTERPLLVHFGLRECQLVVCGACMDARLFNTDCILRDVAQWSKKHWERFQSRHGLPPHDTTQCYSEGVLIDILAESINATNKRQTVGPQLTCGPRTILLPESFLVNTFGATRIEELKGTHPQQRLVKVCNKCLREANDTWCCAGSRLILVFRLQAAKRMEPLLCTNDAANLAHEATMLASLAELATQANQVSISLSPPSCPHPQVSLSSSLPTKATEHALFRSIAEVLISYERGELNTRSTMEQASIPLAPPSCFRPQSSFSNSTPTKTTERPLYRSVAEVLIGYDQGELDARSTMEQVRKIMFLEASRLVDSNGDASSPSSNKRNKQDVNVMTLN